MLASFNHCRSMKAESRQIPQKLAARLKFLYLNSGVHFHVRCNKECLPILTCCKFDLASISQLESSVLMNSGSYIHSFSTLAKWQAVMFLTKNKQCIFCFILPGLRSRRKNDSEHGSGYSSGFCSFSHINIFNCRGVPQVEWKMKLYQAHKTKNIPNFFE